MKVFILCSNYEPGGAQRVALRLLESLNEKGCKTKLYFMHRKSVNFSKVQPNIICNKNLKSIIPTIEMEIKLIKLFRAEKPDVVLSFLPYANTFGLLTAKLCGIKRRIASHRNDCEIDLSGVMKWVDLLCANLGLYTSITAVSEPTKKSFGHYNQKAFKKIFVINNGLDLMESNLTKRECRKHFDLSQDVFIIGTVGRLVDQKNHLFLIDLLPKLENIKLIIVGKGELEEQIIEKAIRLGVFNQLKIIPEVNTEDMMIFLKSLDIFVLPSLVEGMSNALLEALHAGLPIIASDVPSQRNVLQRSEDKMLFGCLIPINEPDEWVKKLRILKKQPGEIKKWRDLSYQRSKDFSLEKMSKEYFNLIMK